MNNRRHFFKSLAGVSILGAGVGAGCVSSSSVSSRRSASANRPRHIIHLVADGMSAGTLSCADHFSREQRGRRLTWFEVAAREGTQAGAMDMRSQDSLVTDSSAASSAWGSGARIPNGKVNQSSDGTKLVPLYPLLREEGWRLGLVTTTEITHATPAGFATCTASRGNADEIAAQYLERRVDVLLGGGSRFFDPQRRADGRDMMAEFRRAGYAVLTTPGELERAPIDRNWLGVFTSGHLPYVVDQTGGLKQIPAAPGLAAMTRRALQQLGAAEHFILQVEGGRVDHACHANDAAGAVREVIAFDEAVDVCLEFQRETPGTLLVLTTDHGNANPGLNGMGGSYRDSSRLFRNLAGIRVSTGELARRLKECGNHEEMTAVFRETAGYDGVRGRRLELLEPFLRGRGRALYGGFDSDVAALGQVLANHTGISFTSTAHTSDIVPVLAAGPGAEAFHGFLECTEVFDRYLEFAGVRFRNPQEPLTAGAFTPAASLENIAEYA